MSTPRIDAHQHFWRLARGDYDWLEPALVPLYRDFEPADLEPLLARAGIARTIAVQAAPTLAETRHLLALAQCTPWIAGVVGWIDFEAPRALDELARERKLVGLRPMLQDLADERWVLRAELRPAFEALERSGLAFDALARPQHLAALCELLERHPRLRVVIDHAAKPALREGSAWSGRARWHSDLRRLAATGCYVKLSGLLTEARPGAGADELAPCVETLFECFGPARVLWGSDWPVVLLAGDYEHWWELSLRLLRGLSALEQERVLGGNAFDFYRLESA